MALTYRYWRMQFYRWLADGTNPSGNFVTIVVEVEMKDADGNNLIGSGTPSASFANYFPASSAFNGSYTDGWGAGSQYGGGSYTTWLQYEFGSQKTVDSLVIVTETSNFPQAVQVLGSNDGFNFDYISPLTLLPNPTVLQPHNVIALGLQPAVETLGIDVGSRADPIDFPGPGITIDPGVLTPGQDGDGYIAGLTEIQGVPVSLTGNRRVRLYRKRDGVLVAETFSDSVGAYIFRNLSLVDRYFVVAFDETLNYNAVIKDNILPVLQP